MHRLAFALLMLLSASAARAEQAPFDLGAVVRRVHFGFRSEATEPGVFTGGHSQYTVRAGAAGHEIRPYRWDGGSVEGAALKLGVAELTRGVDIGRGAAVAEVASDGRFRLRREGVSEELTNREEGVEQSWRFEARPSGAGDLVVRVPFAGQIYAGTTQHGLHFLDPVTGLGFRYGHATWIDAQGNGTDVAAGIEPGHIVLRVPAELVDSSSYPAVLDPIIGSEFGLDSPVSASPAGLDQMNPAIANNGGTWLVVWGDTRA